MFEGITNWVEDKVAGYAKTGIQAGGTLAGNAVGGVGSLVENAGKTAGNTVSGGIGGVGGKIQNYGDGIKRSMSADGPSGSSAQKKTAVKPTGAPAKTPMGAQKTLPSSTGTAKKTGTSTAGSTQKAAPASTQKLGAAQKPTQQQTRGSSAATQPLQNVRNTAAKANAGGARTANATGGAKTQPTLSKGVTNSDGKVRVSAQSMPRAGTNYKSTAVSRGKPTTGAGKNHDSSDPLGIGANFGDMSKPSKGSGGAGGGGGGGGKSQGNFQFQPQNKAQQGAERKPSAGDPLALGDDLMKIGQGKK